MTRDIFSHTVIDRSYDDVRPDELPIINAQPDWDDEAQQHQFTCLQRWQDIRYLINTPESTLK